MIKTIAKWLAGLSIGAAALMGIGPKIEPVLFPVVNILKVTDVSIVDGWTAISVNGVRERACQRLGTIAVTDVGYNTIGSPVKLRDAATGKLIDVPPSVSRPVSDTINFETWYTSSVGTHVRVFNLYRCHPFWVTVQPIADVEVPQK